MNPHLSKIIDLLNTGNYVKAEFELRRLYKENPTSFDLNKMLGLSLLGQRQYNRALKCFEKCYEKKKDDFEIVLNLSYLFTKIQFYEQGLDFGFQAIRINENHPSPYQNIATCYFHLNKFETAEEYALKSINLSGGFDSRLFFDSAEDLVKIYGDILLAQKKNEEFISYAKKLLTLTYNQNTLIKLLRIDRNLIEEKYLETIKQVLAKGEELKNKVSKHTYLSGAHFFLAEYFSKVDIKKSEEHYIVGNKLIADVQRESLFIRQKTIKEIANFFSSNELKEIRNSIDPNKGDGLIFVIGMPRSGTTLTESILATANDTVAGGEKSFFSLQLHHLAKNLIELGSLEVDSQFIEDLGDRYLENIKMHRDGKKFFIDKLPENYLFYKFIKLSLPGAKFIHCFRDPWDNAISLFKQNYSITVFFASSFFGIALEYANYEYLIKLWRQIDGEGAFFDVNYEKLVSSDVSYINELWQYCGLIGEYSEEKRKGHFGYTASFQQVTKEIYKTSLKKDDFIEFKENFYKDLNNQRDYWEKISNN